VSIVAIALWVFIGVLAALAVFQVALIAGAPIGRLAWGGQHRVLPARLRVGSATSIVLYVLFVLIALDRVAVIAIVPDAVTDVAMWVLAAYFALGIIMNGISRSVPERAVMTPVCVVLTAASVVLALS
jgi:hypothetical protein